MTKWVAPGGIFKFFKSILKFLDPFDFIGIFNNGRNPSNKNLRLLPQ